MALCHASFMRRVCLSNLAFNTGMPITAGPEKKPIAIETVYGCNLQGNLLEGGWMDG